MIFAAVRFDFALIDQLQDDLVAGLAGDGGADRNVAAFFLL
jgi:hypothetical protein